jgi:CheY-like chemotaxis protein
MIRRILLADDSLTIQKVVELTFADTDFEVHAVSSGDELIAKLPEVRPDIVICDIIMPGRDGYDVCQTIKSNSDYLHLPVVLLTGTFEPFDRDRALAVGCSEIITKPFEAKRLVEAVEKLTSGAGASHQPTSSRREPDPFDDGRVTPPPPITAPDVLVDVEADYDLADTAITAEVDGDGPIAESADDGLEFTASGFSEMLIAGQEKVEKELDPPTDGLEFDLDNDADETAEAVAASMLDTSDFHSEDITADGHTGAAEDDPFASPQGHEHAVWEDAAEAEPFPVADDGPVFDEPAPTNDLDRNLTTPINVARFMTNDKETPPTGEASPDAPFAEEEVDFSNADTQDFGTQGEPAAEPVEPAEPADGGLGLSDEDVDRIARRVLDLAGDRIDRIAWEVLPDMAEIVVRERVREIEAEVERDRS